ncbi:thermonuclease family protein, partial [Thermus sp. FJN-A]
MRFLRGLAWTVLMGLALALSSQGRLQGPVQVLKVVDGDTVELQGLGPVRLIGVDAPESTYNHRTSGPEEVRLGLEAKA